MNLNKRYVLFLIVSAALVSCTLSEEKQAKDILEKSIEAHGGWNAWDKVETIRFRKWTRLLLEDGTVESETDQFLSFRLQPSFEGTIRWEKDSVEHLAHFDGESMHYSIAGNPVQNPDFLASKKKDFDAAFYVIAQPWKLLEDEGAKLTYVGKREIFSHSVEVVKVDYGPGKDIWWYFFDADSYMMVGNEVQLSDHRSRIENLNYSYADPFIFYGERKSYRVNEAGDNTFLRAEYSYSDFEIENVK